MNDLTPADLSEMYRLMLLSRRFTEQVLQWYKEGRIPQGLHPSIGQEAVGVGACYGLRPGDWVLPSLRTSEAFWARGVTVLQQFNAMYGNTAVRVANPGVPVPHSTKLHMLALPGKEDVIAAIRRVTGYASERVGR